MNFFEYSNNTLHAEEVSCDALANQFGTPLFVYSRKALESAWQAFDQALGEWPHLVCYAVKANSNLSVLNTLAKLGSGFDIVSIGELERVLRAGGDPKKIVFSGLGKRADEMARALEVDIHCFNVESLAELDRLNHVAGQTGKFAPVSIRVNPDVNPQTHPYISTGLKENKFGISIEDAFSAYQKAAALPHLKIIGIDCHIGSQLTEISPYEDALERLLTLVDQLANEGIFLNHIDLGGGQGIQYKDETPIDLSEWAKRIFSILGNRKIELIVEPGRSIAGNAGILLTRVEFLKHSPYKNFAIVDAAMNDLIRPSLYSAWQNITPVIPRKGQSQEYDIVGPVCESSDFLGKDRALTLEKDDLLAVHSAGAYGFVMSSNYNTRPRAAEVMVSGATAHLIRRRETIDELLSQESIPES